MTELPTSPDGLFKEGLKAHHKKKWEEAKEKYNAALESQPTLKLENKLNKYIALLEARFKPPGISGYVSIALFIVTCLIFFAAISIISSPTNVPFISFFVGYLLTIIFAIKSFFETGTANRSIGVTTAIITALLAYYIFIEPIHPYPREDRIRDSLIIAADARVSVVEYIAINQSPPSSNSEVGLEEPAFYSNEFVRSVTVGEGGRVIVEFAGDEIDGKTIIFTPISYDNGALGMECKGGTMPDELRPTICRTEKPD